MKDNIENQNSESVLEKMIQQLKDATDIKSEDKNAPDSQIKVEPKTPQKSVNNQTQLSF